MRPYCNNQLRSQKPHNLSQYFMVVHVKVSQTSFEVVPVFVKRNQSPILKLNRNQHIRCQMFPWVDQQPWEVGVDCHSLGLLGNIVRQIRCSRVIRIVTPQVGLLSILSLCALQIWTCVLTEQQHSVVRLVQVTIVDDTDSFFFVAWHLAEVARFWEMVC